MSDLERAILGDSELEDHLRDQAEYAEVVKREGISKIMEQGRLRALSEERSRIYGDPQQSHVAIGLAWEGIFRNRYQDGADPGAGKLFPDELVALMLAVFKNIRAARPDFHADSYDDAAVYLGYSRSWRESNAK